MLIFLLKAAIVAVGWFLMLVISVIVAGGSRPSAEFTVAMLAVTFGANMVITRGVPPIFAVILAGVLAAAEMYLIHTLGVKMEAEKDLECKKAIENNFSLINCINGIAFGVLAVKLMVHYKLL